MLPGIVAHSAQAMASLPPISLASTIVGFISFSLTLLIWLHAFWDAFLTVGSAPRQVRDQLSTLRQGLYEEREYLRRTRRRQSRSRPPRSPELYTEGGPSRVINDAVKDLIREFKAYERPFLIPPHDGTEKDLEWSWNTTQRHYNCDLPHRILWLRSKGGIESIAGKLQMLQTRRVAAEVTETRFMLADVMGLVRSSEQRLGAIEERLQVR
ncbi:hypothetical protein B7494_g6456 [Chlorociboria aeruginascens]|nr:hypothetical protein B7494_g6456 [Chlorociboria aeruginascens]